MKNNFYFIFLVLVLLVGVLFLVGCEPTLQPDLVPVNPDNWAGFCDIDDSGNLVVNIKNQGLAPAESSHVKVDFGQYGESVKVVSSLGVGDTTSIIIPFPVTGNCFDPDCGFEITVDANDEIDESNELNNSQIGNCIG
jgi:subtilase family serine protease